MIFYYYIFDGSGVGAGGSDAASAGPRRRSLLPRAAQAGKNNSE
jgi:hypothetical protein